MIALVIILSVVSIIATIFIIDDDRLRKKIESFESEIEELKSPTFRHIAVVPHEYQVQTITAEALIDNRDLTKPYIYEFMANRVAAELADKLKDYIKYEEIQEYNPAFGNQRLMHAELKVLKPEGMKDD